MQKTRLFIFILCLIAVSLGSCDGNQMYDESIEIAGDGWKSDDIKSFSFEVEDTMSLLNLYVNLRTTTDYPYSNMYMFMYSEFPGFPVEKDTLEFILAENDGKWVGENSGTIVEFRFKIASGGAFAVPGKYTFKLQHGMSDEVLPEVIDVGFRVEKAE